MFLKYQISKKVLFIVLTLITILLLVACGRQGSIEEGKKTTIGSSARDSGTVLDGLIDSLERLVNTGTITQEQAEIIANTLQDAFVGSGFRFTQDPFIDLVKQGVITQAQADAVRNALGANQRGATR